MGMTDREAQETVRQLSHTAQDRGMRTLPRQRRVAPEYGGGFAVDTIPICQCKIDPQPFDATGRGKDCRRGPAGGVCGNCGGAIPETA